MIKIHIPGDVALDLVELAESRGRSLGEEVLAAIQSHLAKANEPAPPPSLTAAAETPEKRGPGRPPKAK